MIAFNLAEGEEVLRSPSMGVHIHLHIGRREEERNVVSRVAGYQDRGAGIDPAEGLDLAVLNGDRCSWFGGQGVLVRNEINADHVFCRHTQVGEDRFDAPFVAAGDDEDIEAMVLKGVKEIHALAQKAGAPGKGAASQAAVAHWGMQFFLKGRLGEVTHFCKSESCKQLHDISTCFCDLAFCELIEIPIEEKPGEGIERRMGTSFALGGHSERTVSSIKFDARGMVVPDFRRGNAEGQVFDLPVEHRFADIPLDDGAIAVEHGEWPC